MKEDEGQMLLVTLDSSPTSCMYKLKLCGSISSPTDATLTKWTAKASIVELNSEPFDDVSTSALLNFSNMDMC